MNNFLSKLSLYDFLTTILLGGCLYVPFVCDKFQQMPGLMQNDAVTIGLCYLLGLIIHKFAESFDFSHRINSCGKGKKRICMALASPICRNQKALIKRAKDLVGYTSDREIMEEYLQTYYAVMDGNKLGNIPKVEAHSALVRDLVFIVFPVVFMVSSKLSLFCGCCCHKCCNWVAIIFVSLILYMVLLSIRYNCELKIHALIWEQKKYGKLN